MTGPAGRIAAEVAGRPVLVSEVDRREAALRASPVAAALPRRGTGEGRQLRRWLTQMLVAERVVAVEAARRGLTADRAPSTAELLPDPTAHVQIGSVPAALLGASPLARAVFAEITREVALPAGAAREYHARNRARFVIPPPPDPSGWRIFPSNPTANPPPTLPADPTPTAPADPPADAANVTFGPSNEPNVTFAAFEAVRSTIEADLLGAARRRAFTRWLDTALAELVRLSPGYEHPGDPRQPDNTHRH